MTQKETKQFFESVKSDDLVSFCAFVENDVKLLNVSFGRFPLLSTLYLFESKKILNKFEKKLLSIVNFCVINEPFELYKIFKSKSEKSLRLYAGKQNFVMPIEMLAILHKDKKVKKLFAGKNENLQKIYNFNSQKILMTEKKIKIAPGHKTVKKIKFGSLATFSSAILVACFFVFAVFFGLGTVNFPRQISGAPDIVSVANSTSFCTLNNDITIDGGMVSNFSAKLDANNHTIKVKNGKSLFDKFSGVLKNATIEFVEEDLVLSDSVGIIANENSGKIENVNVVYSGSVKAQAELQFCGFVLKNSGEISNSTAEFDVNISSNCGKDVYFAGFVYENEGEISNCKVLESNVVCKDVDICGIAVTNKTDAEISNCENSADISQIVETKDWSPTLAGITLINLGKIENCINYGKISATNEIENNENSTILAGGICAINHKDVLHSKNEAEIFVSGKTSTIFVGGICAQVIVQDNNNAGVDACASAGKITIEKQSNDYYAFGGGIVGYLRGAAYNNGVLGYVNNSYTKCEFGTAYDVENKNLIGAVFGSIYSVQYFYQINVYVEVKYDYYLTSANVPKSTASVHLVKTTISDDVENEFNTSGELTSSNYYPCSTVEEIETCPVYW